MWVVYIYIYFVYFFVFWRGKIGFCRVCLVGGRFKKVLVFFLNNFKIIFNICNEKINIFVINLFYKKKIKVW